MNGKNWIPASKAEALKRNGQDRCHAHVPTRWIRWGVRRLEGRCGNPAGHGPDGILCKLHARMLEKRMEDEHVPKS